MSRELLEALGAHEAEVVAILTPLYAEVRHWESELANTRKAKKVAAMAMAAHSPSPSSLTAQRESRA